MSDETERRDGCSESTGLPTARESGDGVARAGYFLVLGSFLFALVYLFVRAVGGEGVEQSGEVRIIIFQLVMGCVFLRLPYFISRVARVRVPTGLSVGYFAFLWCAIFLGEFAMLYYRVAVWDSLLHLFSAALAALAALSLPSLLGVRGQPLISALVAVGAALTLGVAWEVYEFAFDGILGLNMQKFAGLTAAGVTDAPLDSLACAAPIPSVCGASAPLSPLSPFDGGNFSFFGGFDGRLFRSFDGSDGRLFRFFDGFDGGLSLLDTPNCSLFPSFGGSDGGLSLLDTPEGGETLTPLVGRAALVDTMSDLILDFLGAVTVGVWGYLRIKRHGDLPPAVKILPRP